MACWREERGGRARTWSFVSPWPRLPKLPSPHVYTSPWSSTTTVWSAPHATCLMWTVSGKYALSENARTKHGRLGFLGAQARGERQRQRSARGVRAAAAQGRTSAARWPRPPRSQCPMYLCGQDGPGGAVVGQKRPVCAPRRGRRRSAPWPPCPTCTGRRWQSPRRCGSSPPRPGQHAFPEGAQCADGAASRGVARRA